MLFQMKRVTVVFLFVYELILSTFASFTQPLYPQAVSALGQSTNPQPHLGLVK